MSILDKTAAELGAAIKNGEVTVMQAVEASLSRIEESESLYNCYVTVDREGALAKAQEIQKKIHQCIAEIYEMKYDVTKMAGNFHSITK